MVIYLYSAAVVSNKKWYKVTHLCKKKSMTSKILDAHWNNLGNFLKT